MDKYLNIKQINNKLYTSFIEIIIRRFVKKILLIRINSITKISQLEINYFDKSLLASGKK